MIQQVQVNTELGQFTYYRLIICRSFDWVFQGISWAARTVILLKLYVFLYYYYCIPFSSTTKLVIFTSLFYALQLNKIVDVSLASSSLIFTVVFATFQVLFLYTTQGDPFAPVEDALAAIFLRHPEQRASSSANESKKKSD